MKVSVVIVNYKVKYFLEQCLLSVRKSLDGLEAEVFVVDNDSQDGSLEYLKPLFPEVYFIANQENVGFAKANNQAILLSTGEYILLLNPDTLLSENVIRDVILFMDKHAEAGGVGVKMIDGRGRFLPESKRSMPTPWVSFCKIFGLSALFPKSRFFGRYSLGYLDENRVHPIDVMAGAFMMLRKKALDKIGLLDERFFMYGEDIDLSYRLTNEGYRNYYLPAKILHYKGESTPKHTIKYVKIFYEAMDIFFKKHNPQASFIYAVVIRFAILIRAVMAGLYRICSKIWMPFQKFQHKEKKKVLICATENCSSEIEDLFREDQQTKDLYVFSPRGNKTEGVRSFVKENQITDVVFSDSMFEYGDMLSLMEKLTSLGVDFSIHSQQSKTIISSNQSYKIKAYAGE